MCHQVYCWPFSPDRKSRFLGRGGTIQLKIAREVLKTLRATFKIGS